MFDVTTLQIRLADDRDVPAVHRLVRDSYREHIARGLNFTGTYQDEQMTRERMSWGDVYLLCERDTIVGTVTLGRDDDPDGHYALYVSQLAVHPSWQRRGIGRHLLHLAVEQAKQKGAEFLRLDTAQPAKHLVAFYESEGFAIVGEAQWEGKTYRSFIMEKSLLQNPTAI